MIYRPHFTYIEAATPEQRQAREAAANEEWRKKLIFHTVLSHPEPWWYRFLPHPEHRPEPSVEPWWYRFLPHPEERRPAPEIPVRQHFTGGIARAPEVQRITSPFGGPGIGIILPHEVTRKPEVRVSNANETETNTSPPPTASIPVRQHFVGGIGRLPEVQQITSPFGGPGIGIVLPQPHETSQQQTASGSDQTSTSTREFVNPRLIREPGGPGESSASTSSTVREFVNPRLIREPGGPGESSIQTQTSSGSGTTNRTILDRQLSFMQQAEGVTSSSPSSQSTQQQTQQQQTAPPILDRQLSFLQHAEGTSTTPPPTTTQQQNPQQMIDQMISQGVNLPAGVNSPSPGPIIANASTPQSNSQQSNPFGAIGSFFGSLASGITNVAKDVGSAITGALSTANNAIQSTYNSVYGSQTQQEKQQLQSQAQQELSQISQEKQQLQNELQQVQQYEAQAEQMLQQNPNDQQLKNYLQQLQQAQQQIQQGLTQLNQAQQQVQQDMTKLNKQGQGNPFSAFFNDIAEASALAGYYTTEGLGGIGEEIANVVKGKGLENFSQAMSQFNKAGGQNVAKAVGDVTEVALPAIATAIVAPELLPAELIGEAASVGIGEGISKITTGKWQSLPQVLQEANEGGVLGAIGEAGGLALESGLAKGAGALTKVLSGSEDLASKISGLTPVWRATGGALTNAALQAPFTQNPEQLGIAAAIGGLAGGLGPGVAGKLMSKIDEIRGTGGVAELETLKSPLTGETTEAWKVTLPNGDVIHITPRTTFGEGDINDFADTYSGKTTLAIHSTPARQFLDKVANGEETVEVTGSPPGGAFKFREPGKLRDLYLSPGESEKEGVALAGYAGIRDTRPGIPELRLGQSDVKSVLSRFLHPFDQGGLIGVKTDADVIEPPEELRDYILSKKTEYLRQGVNPKDLNNVVMEDLLKDEKYGNMYRDYINKVRTYSAETGKPVIDIEGLLGLSHERQIELATGAKLRGAGDEYNIWIRQTPELLKNLPGPLRDILSDWSRLKYVGAEIVPGEPLNLFEDKEGGKIEDEGANWERKVENIIDEGKEKTIPETNKQTVEENTSERMEGEENIPREQIELPERTEEETIPQDLFRNWVEPPPTIYNPPRDTINNLPTISSPPPLYNPPSPINSPPPIVNPPSPIINSPPTINPPPSPIINPPPSPIVNPPPSPIINPPPSPIISPPPSPIINPPPSPIVNPPPPPIVNPPPSSVEEENTQSPPPPVFSPSAILQNESPPPMGPPPMLPAMIPGGFGNGGNNIQEISGAAGEVIYL
ncbi:FAD-dependent pyridine nucleotide-disulphideoxido reductase [Sulfolobus islandicus L.S.2.15]|uniref:FAD-dependent pyridine nucleotide-disulphideoxido reductase n=1 Tax=Saccharolobus islandicus (strain L.S.2.15 / Lassen \|nr:pyridine nucleotide-disulfide oxidoreductase [Sulfolobus islandicus]ACP35567.1 FAD-dependent pyridine nucleotide-disulphideoxido reductase [Sulfolobus islandicus L.S.2.15]